MSVRLSVCMPVHNFGAFIGATLDSVIAQAAEDVEIVVLDGASTDNTADVVQQYQKKFPRLNYHRLDKKGGIDRDMAKTVDLATGQYCWLLSGDDVLKPGALQRVIDETGSGNDIYLCNRTDCDKDLVPLKETLWLSPSVGDRVFDFTKKNGFINYFEVSQSLGALFSYMSSIIVRRSKWNEIAYDDAFTGSNYAHVFRLFRILQQGGSLKYLRDTLVLCRGDNDSFMARGLFNRNLIDFNGYHLLATRLFADRELRRAFLSVQNRHYSWTHFINLRRIAPQDFDWKTFESKLMDFGYSRSQLLAAKTIAYQPVYTTARFLGRLGKALGKGKTTRMIAS